MTLAFQSENEVQELSLQDADELHAFLDKRRWFESKLAALEQAPPLYPFLHPHLRHTANDEQITSIPYELSIDNGLRLPNVDEVKAWQADRDQIEDEVLRFDGGDLGRMKRKIREITLVPLTQPSTHLVSVTLDLIVLIDRLLTLLRRREELLQLATFRLHWDKLRWEIMLETEGIRQEIRSIIDAKGVWSPPPKAEESPVHRRKSSDLAHQVVMVSPDKSGGPNKQGDRDIHNVTTPRRISLSMAMSTPSPSRTSMQLPILHSQIANVEARHRNLSSTSVLRSGTMLDKMMDLSGHLGDVGGVEGPCEGSKIKSEGAVPEDLLDIQDNLESELVELEQKIQSCHTLEAQWKFANDHYDASRHTADRAAHLLQSIKEAVVEPISGSILRDLLALWHGLRQSLPPLAVTQIPRLNAPSSLQEHDRTTAVLAVLDAEREQASHRLSTCDQALQWLQKFVDVEDSVSVLGRQLSEMHIDLEARLSGRNSVSVWSLQDMRGDSFTERWNEVSTWVNEVKTLCQKGAATCQATELANMTRQSVVRCMPDLDGQTVSPNEDRANAVGRERDELLRLMRNTKHEELAWMVELGQAVHPITTTLEEIRVQIESSKSKNEDIAKSATPDTKTVALLENCVASLSERMSQDIAEPFSRLPAPTLAAEEPIFLRELSEEIDRNQRALVDLNQVIHSWKQAVQQNELVSIIEGEATTFLAKIEEARSSLESLLGEDLDIDDLLAKRQPSAAVLSREIKTWEVALPNRAVSLTNPSDRGVVAGHQATVATKPALIPRGPNIWQGAPLDALTVASKIPVKLAGQDLNARDRVNEAAARVRSAQERMDSEMDAAPTRHWTIHMLKALEELADATTSAQELCQDISSVLASLERNVRQLDDEFLPPVDQETLTAAQNERALLMGAMECTIVKYKAGPTAFRDDLQIEEEFDQAVTKAEQTIETLTHLESQVEQIIHRRSQQKGKGRERLEGSSSWLFTFSHTPEEQLASLRSFLAEVNIDELVHPPIASHLSSFKQLPTAAKAAEVGRHLAVISEAMTDFEERAGPHTPSGQSLRKEVNRQIARLPRLDKLAKVSSSLEECDQAFSGLLDLLDGRVEDLMELIETADHHAWQSFETLREAAEVIKTDRRVLGALKHTRTTWEEMHSLVEKALNPDRPATPTEDDDSVTVLQESETGTERSPSPTPTIRRSKLSPTPSIATSRIPRSSRVLSSPLAANYLSPTKSSQARHSSNPTSMGSSSEPPLGPRESRSNASSTSLSSLLTKRDVFAPGPSSRLSRQTSSSSQINGHPTRPNPKPSSRSTKPRSSLPGRITNPKKKLDVAVGRVLEELKVDIPVRSAERGPGERWEDMSGKYWIGAEGRAKLCFCRILRSKTVMVRVGGGWVELSRFLLDHFAESLGQLEGPPENGKMGSIEPIRITSASLKTPAKIPMRVSAGGRSRETSLSPQKLNYLSPLSASSSPGSPLQPLQFIRKASESPPVLQQEKAMLLGGRRSILSREISSGRERDES